MTTPQKVISATEPWAEYQLEDGTTIRLRLTACNFRKTGKTTEQGDPEFSFSQQIQCETIAPLTQVTMLGIAREQEVREKCLA